MKNLIKILFCFTFIFVCITSLTSSKINNALASFNNSSEIVIDLNTNRILYENNSNDKKYMASTTKILTAIVIIENCNLNDSVIIKKEATNIEGSSIYLEEGEILTVKHLLYGLMLRSGNDCAVALALHCSNSINDFAKLMNQTAKKIGAKNSNFTNPHGLHNDNHYTTAYDLAIISSYALKNEDFREIVGTKKIKIPNTKKDYDRILINKNKMLSDYKDSTGVKTGYTKKAGRCLVSSAKKGQLELVCVVLNCPPMFERSKELLDSTFNNYKPKKVVNADYIVDFIDNNKNNEKIPIYIKRDIIVPLTEEEYKNLKIDFEYPKKLIKTAKKDEEIGFIKIYSKNNLIFTEKIYIMVNEQK